MGDDTKLGIATIPIRATLDQLDQDLAAAKGKAQSGVNELNSVFGKIGLGHMVAGASIAGLSKFLGDSVEAGRDAQKTQAELNAVLASTKGVAGVTADEINEMAQALMKVTKYDDDAIIDGQSMLLTFTNIGKDVFPEATEAMLNMAEKFGSIDQASIQLGKALNDPILGVTALRRIGIQLSETQEDQIKAFMESGRVADAQRVILGELETQFGGLARKIGETSEGQVAIFNNKMGEVQESIGLGLLPTIDRLYEGFDRLLDPLGKSNDEIQVLVDVIAKFEAKPLIAAMDHAAFVMDQVNAVLGFLNDLLADVQKRLGITSDKTQDMGESFKAVMLPITLLTQGPLAALVDALKVAADLWEQIHSFNPASVWPDVQNIGRNWHLPGFAEGGIVPGPVGQPQLAVVHGGEMVIPSEVMFGGSTEHTIRFEGAPAGISQAALERVVREVLVSDLANYVRSRP